MLQKWQWLAGWINWSFNVFPLLQPCLNNFYPKFQVKTDQMRKIWVNNDIQDNLHWACQHI